ncbi:hypothetical protein SLA2020_467350 [Shorea laevis]
MEKLFVLIHAFILILSTFLPLVFGSPPQEVAIRRDEVDQFQGVPSVLNALRRKWEEASSSNHSFILAANRTLRQDPLNGLKYYTGGWNLLNQHYIASVVYTALPFVLVAALWFLLWGLFLLCRCLCCCCSFCCGHKSPTDYSRTAYACYLTFLILFTSAAICGCAVLYVGQGRFHDSVGDTLEYIVKQGLNIFHSLTNLVQYLSSAKMIKVADNILPIDIKNTIDDVDSMINKFANLPEIKSLERTQYVRQIVEPSRTALIVLAALMLVLICLGFLFSVLGMRFCIHILVVLGWILVTLTCLLCGAFLVFHNVVADTCLAMDEWVQNPTADSALSDVLPCWDSETGKKVLNVTSLVTSQMDGMMNEFIKNIANNDDIKNIANNLNTPKEVKDSGVYYNQSGPLAPLICNPNANEPTQKQCPLGTVDYINATQEWKKYVCEVSANGVCTSQGRLTPSIYSQLTAAVNVSYGLYNYGPFLSSLTDCTYVRQTFGHISQNYCPNLGKYSEWVYSGTVTVSAAVMFSLIFWLSYTTERRRRAHTKKANKSHPEYPLIGRTGL